MLPIVLLITLTAVYVQDGDIIAIWVVLTFGVIGYVLRRLDISILPFLIRFILTPQLEELIRNRYSASGSNPWFLLRSPLALFFLAGAVAVIVFSARRNSRTTHCTNH
ncbi:MAG: tripartite tricarboxylate transporter permease [Burkholderiaceae bacterium]